MYTPLQDSQEAFVTARAGSVHLTGRLSVPPGADTLILCIHNSGQWKHSPRNHYFARLLRQSGCATLLLDLLTPTEENHDSRMGRMRANSDLLADRLVKSVDWTRDYAATRCLKLGLFGGGNAANTVLLAAVARPQAIAGVVVCNGPVLSLISLALRHTHVPTLLITGGDDLDSVARHQAALVQLGGPKQLVVIPGAVHPFEESGAIEQVARLSSQWFHRLERQAQPATRTFSLV
jgi:putative phosphoribosyl transferase